MTIEMQHRERGMDSEMWLTACRSMKTARAVTAMKMGKLRLLKGREMRGKIESMMK